MTREQHELARSHNLALRDPDRPEKGWRLIKTTRLRLTLVLPAALLLAAVVAVRPASAAPKTVNGSVGPGFTITLKLGGKKVTRLKPTTYRFRVTDKSSIHDFHLSGPGVNRVITGVGFKGTKTVTVKLKRGTYRYVCDPHSGQMHGSFNVR